MLKALKDGLVVQNHIGRSQKPSSSVASLFFTM